MLTPARIEFESVDPMRVSWHSAHEVPYSSAGSPVLPKLLLFLCASRRRLHQMPIGDYHYLRYSEGIRNLYMHQLRTENPCVAGSIPALTTGIEKCCSVVAQFMRIWSSLRSNRELNFAHDRIEWGSWIVGVVGRLTFRRSVKGSRSIPIETNPSTQT